MRCGVLPIACMALAGTAPAETVNLPPRAADVVAILNGGGRIADSFTPAFIADVPEARLRALAAGLVADNGRVLRVTRAVPIGRNRYALIVAQDRADLSVQLTLEDAAPHRISGLLISGSAARLPGFAAVAAAIRALPGTTAFAVTRLGDGAPVSLAAAAPGRAQAVGSTFKLLVLAALVQAIDRGDRHWEDVVPLTVRSVPSGILQDWPEGVPLTLHSLATLMIAQSDNSATDTLIALLGRDRVAAMAGPLGWPPHPGNDPFLTTLEMATLKGAAGGALGDRYAVATPPARRDLLAGPVAASPRAAIDYAALETRPQHIDRIEWFASPDAVVRALDWFRRQQARPAGAAALAILAVNHGLPPADVAGFDYVGYKGGSEAGVLAMSYLLRTQAGAWVAVSASWNDPAAMVAPHRLVPLVTRLVQLVREGR